MRAQVQNLAERIKSKRLESSTYLLLLGAGASISSKVPPTSKIMEELVDRYDRGLTGSTEDRFDKLWRSSSPDERRRFLTPYLDREPSPGYLRLAQLVQAGFFELIITFNFDRLLEKALDSIGFRDYKVIVRGEVTEPDTLARMVEQPAAKLTLLKLHGSLYGADSFLFDQEEMVNYPEKLEALVRRLTCRDVLSCGYSFRDLCVLKAFSPEGGTVFCVNPSGAPANLKGILIRRRSQERVISGDLGNFDRFFAALHEELTRDVPSPTARRPRYNPFKFLDSYDLGDKDWFFGRRELTAKVLARLQDGPPSTLHLIGPEKAGKTSFVRAGLLARLDPNAWERLYVRCRPDLERQLSDDLAQRLGRAPAAGPAEALRDIAAASPKRTILVLDQFDRVLRARLRDDQDWQSLCDLFHTLCLHEQPGLTLVFVAVDDHYHKLIVESRVDAFPENVRPLPGRRMEAVVRLSAWKSGIALDRRIVRDLVERLSGGSFTPAHLQAICHLLVYNSWTDWQRYEQNVTRELEYALDQAISACDFLNLVEDFPLREGRHLVRTLMKVVSEPSKRKIAAFVKERFADLLADAIYPEPL